MKYFGSLLCVAPVSSLRPFRAASRKYQEIIHWRATSAHIRQPTDIDHDSLNDFVTQMLPSFIRTIDSPYIALSFKISFFSRCRRRLCCCCCQWRFAAEPERDNRSSEVWAEGMINVTSNGCYHSKHRRLHSDTLWPINTLHINPRLSDVDSLLYTSTFHKSPQRPPPRRHYFKWLLKTEGQMTNS